jgi:hypothetical protein
LRLFPRFHSSPLERAKTAIRERERRERKRERERESELICAGGLSGAQRT